MSQAVQFNCSDYPVIDGFHTIDGFDDRSSEGFAASAPAPDNIKIDVNCRIRNYPQGFPGGFNTNFSFINNDPDPKLVIFDNVFHTGNMSCNSVAGHMIWFVNGSSSKILEGNCQNLLVPVPKIEKEALDDDGNAISFATVGVPFTYQLTLPVVFDAGSGTVVNPNGYIEPIENISIWDDISEAALGVNLSYLGHTATLKSSGMPLGHDFSNAGGLLTFDNFANAPLQVGDQIIIDIEVVLDNTALNTVGSAFVNVAEWQLSTTICNDASPPECQTFDPLPGESGRAELLTISAPDLVVNKSTTATAVNFSDTVAYTVDAQNIDAAPAWNIRVEDQLPVGMRDFSSLASLAVSVLASDHATVLRTLTDTVDYSASYDAVSGLLVVELTDAAGPLEASQFLRLRYDSQLDQLAGSSPPDDGDVLTNVAGATEWFNADSSVGSRVRYPVPDKPLTDGTPGVDDNQDNASVTAALSGYFFEKTVENLTTGAFPGSSASPGDDLRYRLRLFNLDQQINDITITDALDTSRFQFDAGSLQCPAGASCTLGAGDVLTITGDGAPLDAAEGNDIVVQFDVQVLASLANGEVISNQAQLQAVNDLNEPLQADSDDPFVNGVVNQADPDAPASDPTLTSVVVVGPLSKANPAASSVTIGEQFTYTVLVPATPMEAPLFDVQIQDDLAATGVDLAFIGATASINGGPQLTLSNSGSASNLLLVDASGGLDIPANGQAEVAITVELRNTVANQDGDSFFNTASYSFNRAKGNEALRTDGGSDSTAPMTVVEPLLMLDKSVANVTPGKGPADPAAGGDVLEYTLLMPNNGSATAFDITVTDTFPEGVALQPGSAQAEIDGGAVAGFNPEPTEIDDGVLVWGDANGDGSLDVPVGSTLLVRYRVNVTDASHASFANSVVAEWTSLQGGSNSERSGAGCTLLPAPEPDDYCAGPAVATLAGVDTNAFNKSVLSDSWDDVYSSADDALLRVGDTVVYQLALTLREGLTGNVLVSDTLPQGLAFEGTLSINGETVAPYSSVAPFSHADIAAPVVDAASNTVTWAIGDVDNAINNDPADDTFIILYQARVVTDTLAHVDSTTLSNGAQFSYDGGDVLTDSVDIEVRQPLLVTLSKTDALGNSYPDSSAPLNVDIANDVMQFQLEACNDSASSAPAYSLQLVDNLAPELDETSITTPLVTVNGAVQNEGTDYSYTAPASRGGSMIVDLDVPVEAGQCALVEYSIGFHTDVAANQLWNNNVSVAQYWSLPAAEGQQYAALGPVEFWMSNQSEDPLPLKTLLSPASVATIGETVVYEITIPAINASRSEVVISDTLAAQLVFDSASLSIDGGAATALTNTGTASQITVNLGTIQAGQEAVVTLTTHVANTVDANAGDLVSNSASYTYTDGPLLSSDTAQDPVFTVVEPQVSLGKVANVATVEAGDLINYTVTLTEAGNADSSGAFDLLLTDTLDAGLAYEPGSTRINSVAAPDPAIAGQTLTWPERDLAIGETVTVEYQARVEDSVLAGQTLSNQAAATWTSLAGTPVNEERDGSDGVGGEVNDYAAEAAVPVTVAEPLLALVKSHAGNSYDPAVTEVRVGDTVDYRLRIDLPDGSYNNVVFTDQLPTGLAYDSMVSATVFGTAVSPAPEPTTADGQALTWNLGNQVNLAEADSSNDYIELVYRATALTDTLAQQPTSQDLLNTATFAYDGDSQTFSDEDSETITLLQPLMDLSKTERQGRASPYQVDDMVNDVMQFRLQSCNSGNAPSYSLKLEDDLPWELDETSLSNVQVAMDDGSAVAYSDNLPVARDGTVIFTLSTPVAPGQCVLVDYDIGFHTDVPANQTWENSVSVTEYWSLDGAAGQLYQPVGPALFVMTNNVTDQPPLKTLSSATTATIGDTVTYTISVPEANAQRDNVVVTDTLPQQLTFVNATVSIDGGAASALTNTGTSSAPSLNIGALAAGQSAVVTLNTRVLNTADSNAGDIPGNIASYTYDGLAPSEVVSAENTELTIVEPQVSLSKDARDASNATITEAMAGDVIHYTVTLAEAGNADSSDAFDLVLTDTLSAGLEYVPGSASIGDPATIAVDGDGNALLTWAARDLTAGDTLVVTYQAQVQDSVVGGQALSNNAVATWTSRAGDDTPNERDGSDGVGGVNDYVASDTVTLTVPVNVPVFTKQVEADTFTDTGTASDGIARPGDWIDYELRVTLEKGTHTDLVLQDILPAELAFDSMLSASFFGVEQSPPPANEGSAQNLQWTLGNQTNPAGSASDDIVLSYRVLVANNLTQVDSTTLTNNASLDYTVAGVAQPARESSADSTIWQPNLSVEKSVTTSDGDSVIVAGETVTYTVDIINSGTAPAYDTVLRDILPQGMRNNGGPTTTSVSLVNAGTVLAPFVTSYSAADGVAIWEFDSAANNIAIPAQDTLRVVYTVTADNDLGADLTLENSALVTDYYSFDDDDIPSGDVLNRQHYGPSTAAVATLTTPGAGALQKSITQPTAAVGEPFSYEITVPATPVEIALSDVHVLDDLSASAAALALVSARYSLDGGASWAAMSNVGTATALDLVDQGTAAGLDIPASGQALVEISVVLQDDPANVAGLVFNNTATYSYSGFSGDTATLADTSEDMTIIAPDLVMTKSGPATMSVGTPELFTLDVQNVGTSTAWDITLTDHLPNLASGGMCDTPPALDSVVVYESDGATAVATLVENSDFTTSFAAGTPCVFTLVAETSAAVLEPGQILRVIYQAELDSDTPANIELTNYAGATEWFSAADSAPQRRTFSHVLMDVKEEIADPQDYHTLITNPPELTVDKTVVIQNDVAGNGQANPGDTLRYTITVTNTSQVLLPDFSLVDDLGALHAEVVFAPGSLLLVSLPAGAVDSSDPNGGRNGAGLVDVGNLSLGAQGSGQDSVTLVFDVTLAAAIDNGTVVLNQGRVEAFGSTLQLTDDPSLPGDEDPTGITVQSAPLIQVQKVSADLTGDPDVLMPGDTLRYTLTVRNTGNENAVNVSLRDAVPEHTRYVPGSTTLNGTVVADAAGGSSPLAAGMLINAPGNSTPGSLDAQAPSNVATIIFNVLVNDDAVPGTLIVNQGFVNGRGAGGRDFMEQPSDDPATEAVNDPTIDIVGDLPLLVAHKTVALLDDANGNSAPDPGDTLRYSIVISNRTASPASAVVLTDQIPDNTSYLAGSTTLDGVAQADVAGSSALVSGLEIGDLAGNSSVLVTLDVRIDAGVADGTLISNQGLLTSNELPDEPTDADGIPANGHQPTVIMTGMSQQLSIVKNVAVSGGGAVLPGAELEYTVQVTNTGIVPATQVLLSDDLTVFDGLASYVADSARLNGGSAGIDDSGPILRGDYASAFGDLPVGASATLRFKVLLSNDVAVGTPVSNTAEVSWNNATQSASSTVTVEVGAIPGTATLSGLVWHDSNVDSAYDSGEPVLPGWTVELRRNGARLRTASTDDSGEYRFIGLPRTQTGQGYELRFRAPGATATTAKLGLAVSPFNNSLQRITDISAAADTQVTDLNLPIQPNGVVYNSISRESVAGATLTMLNSAGNALASSCFDDPAQQGQVSIDSGFYKFDLNLSDPSCRSADYLIEVVAPEGDEFEEGVSRVILPVTDADTAAYDVPSCFDDAVTDTTVCEAQAGGYPQPPSVAAESPLHRYYLRLAFSNGVVPDDSQIFNNHIPLDPLLSGAVSISKTASVVNVSRGKFVPYEIRVKSGFPLALPNLMIVDSFPAGFKYVEGSARLDDQPVELQMQGRQLILPDLTLQPDAQHSLKLLFIVGSGVSEGEYVNRAQVFQALATRSNHNNSREVSGEASASVRVVPDPDFDCTDVIGKVFDDKNLNGYQDDGEAGLPGVRLVTARGLQVTTDAHGRFHITCAVVPNENRGGNFILKVDDRTLPSGYRFTTENPLVRRATRGKMIKFNFGAALHRVVALDLADDVFEPGSSTLRPQWQSRLPLLMEQLTVDASILRLAYMAEIESRRLVDQRLRAIKRLIGKQWAELDSPYELTIETEVFWRTGAPPAKGGRQ